MAAANQDSQQRIATLVEIEVPTREPIRLQNYQRNGDYFYRGKPYEYIGFEGGSNASRKIGLGTTGGTITVGNVGAARNSHRPIRDWLFRDSGWRDATITIVHLWPEDLSTPPIVELRKVSAASIVGAEVRLTLKSGTNAVNARIPNLALTRQLAPELPSTSPRRV